MVVFLLLFLPATGGADGIQPGADEFLTGTVVEDGSGAPVAGALVSLLDVEGELQRSLLTGPDGRFSFRLPGPGTWSVQVARLGYGESRSDPVEILEGESASMEVRITSAPFMLEAVEVQAAATGVCRPLGGEDGSLLARLWQEARSALRVVAWAEEEGRYQFELSRWNRTTDLVENRVVEEAHGERTRSLRPFQTAPVAELLEEGWIRSVEGDENTFDYYGVDANALLSDEFERSHCFEIRQDPDDLDRVGLGFRPAVDLERPGVIGTLWLDRESAALQRLEFHYTSHPHEPPIPPALLHIFGGEVEYRELPDGGWIVDRWSLRLPQYQVLLTAVHRTSGQVERRFAGEMAYLIEEQPRSWRDAVREARLGTVEEGGELLGVTTPAGEYVPSREHAALEGTVVDSTRMAGLEGAVVQLTGTPHSAQTDRAGNFRIEVPLDGRYAVNFDHPRLDSLGVASIPEQEVSLERGRTSRVELGVPTERTLAILACGREPGTGSEGMLWGRVLERAMAAPLAGVTVRLVPDQAGPGADTFEAVTNPDGRYQFCEVPPQVPYTAQSSFLGVEGEPRSIRIAEGAAVSMDLRIAVSGVGEVRGSVREGATGPPIGNARVELVGGGELHAVQTDSEGRFTFSAIAAGDYGLLVTHVGYRQLETELEVEGGGRTTNVNVRLLRDAIALDPIEVEVEARPSWGVLAEVYDRRDHMKALGIGHFFDRNDIERSASAQVTSLVQRLPGTTRRPIAAGSGAYVLQIHRTNECEPAFFVDGMRYHLDEGESIDHVVSLWVVEMIEVYRSPAQLPMEFFDYDASRCGAVAVWTRRGH